MLTYEQISQVLWARAKVLNEQADNGIDTEDIESEDLIRLIGEELNVKN